MGMGEIPSLTGLDRSAPDYVTRLEQGLAGVREMTEVVIRDAEKLYDESGVVLRRNLAKIDGVMATELPRIQEEERVGEDVVRSLTIDRVWYNFRDNEARRQFENAERCHRRNYEDGMRGIEDRLGTLERAGEDFSEALHELTELRPLNDISATAKGVVFYIVRPDGVYECGGMSNDREKRCKAWGPEKSTVVGLEDTTDSTKLGEIGKAAGDITAYLVTHPSNIATPDTLAESAMRKYVIAYAEVTRRQREGEASKTAAKPVGEKVRESLGGRLAKLLGRD